MRAVVLDLDTLKPDELDLQQLYSLPLQWQSYANTGPDQVMERIKGASIVITNKVVLDANILAANPQLQYIGVLATGTNNIDMQAAAEAGICVNNVEAYGTASVVQHAMMLMLALAGNFKGYQQDVAAGQWSASPMFCLMSRPMIELAGKTLLIVGYGELGRQMANLGQAFGMQVEIARRPGMAAQKDDNRMELTEGLTRADVVSLHCLLSPDTHHLINAETLAQMKPGALLINSARGPLVDEAALLQALQSGHLGGAGLDVLEHEPPARDNVLLNAGLNNLIITPHNAWATREARQRLVDIAADKLKGFLTC